MTDTTADNFDPKPLPSDNRPLVHEILSERNKDLRPLLEANGVDLVNRRDDLLEATANAPTVITSEEESHKVQDLLKMITACAKDCEARRKSDKAPTRDAGAIVDGFYKSIADQPFKNSPLATADKTLRTPLNVYLRKKAEAERRAREEVERKAKEEAERAAREAQRLEREARDAKGLEAAIAAEEAAKIAAADAEKAQKEADAKPAELSRTRSDLGAVASLSTRWVHAPEDEACTDLVDRDKIDKDLIWPFIPMDALNQAMNGYVKAGGRDCRGAKIFETTSVVVR